MSNPRNDGVRGAIANTRQQQSTDVAARQQSGEPTIYQLIDRQKTEIAKALPKHMDADRLARVIITVIRSNPKLLECSQASLLGAAMLSAQTGLEPGPLGHCYWVPFWNNKLKTNEVTWIMGYKGLIDLANRSGQMASPVFARCVYKGDEFSYDYGLDEGLHHVPNPEADRDDANLIAVYGIARFKDGGRYFEVMHRPEIEKRRQRSKSKDNGPWVTDFARMSMKSVIRSMAPFLPLSVESSHALAADERAHTQVGMRLDDIGMAVPADELLRLDAAPDGVNIVTGEIAPETAEPLTDEQRAELQAEQFAAAEPAAGDVGTIDVEDPPNVGWPETAAPGSKR